MFSGIVTEVGTVEALEGGAVRVRGGDSLRRTKPGGSIAVNGVCLTAALIDGDVFLADVMPETLRHTGLGRLGPGSRVNLEPALGFGDEVGGHLVQGHVDGVGEVVAVSDEGNARWVSVRVPPEVREYCVLKGSIAIDGISLTIGVLDQTNPAMAPHYQDLRSEVGDLTTFTRSLETKVSHGCSVFQLPIVPYPESPPVHDMADYAHFRPSLVSSSLRWSYGAFRGTTMADWQLALPQRSTSALLDDLVAVGFCAVEVDRAGYADGGTALDGELTALLGQPIATTHDDRLVAWDLAPHRASLLSRLGADQMSVAGDLVSHPVVVYSDQGAYGAELDQGTPFQWTGPAPVIDIHNFSRTTVNGVDLTFSLAAPDSAPRRFTVHLPNGSTQVVDVKSGAAREVQVEVNAAPGPNVVTITTEGAAVSISTLDHTNAADHRIVFGKLIDLRASDIDPKIRLGVVQQRVE